MPPSSNGGGCAAQGRTQNAQAAVSLTKSIPPTPPHFEHWQLRGVGNIEPNDEIGQRPAVLSLPSLVAIGPRKDAMNVTSRELGSQHTQLAILRAPLQLLAGRECGRAYQ